MHNSIVFCSEVSFTASLSNNDCIFVQPARTRCYVGNECCIIYAFFCHGWSPAGPDPSQIYAEAERRANKFAMPRRPSICSRRLNIAEAERRANKFAMPRHPSICSRRLNIAEAERRANKVPQGPGRRPEIPLTGGAGGVDGSRLSKKDV